MRGWSYSRGWSYMPVNAVSWISDRPPTEELDVQTETRDLELA
jgi:hypothetical protein